MTILKVKDTGWNMAGTEQTGEYIVLARTSRGRIGVRHVGNYPIYGAMYRVRVEPVSTAGAKQQTFIGNCLEGWKTPGVVEQYGQQNRWSAVANFETLASMVNIGLHALCTPMASLGAKLKIEQNPAELPDWAKDLITIS